MNGIPAQASVTPGDAANLAGIALLLVYGYFHFQYKQASDDMIRQEARRKSLAVMAGFMFYAVVVATVGIEGTWVAEVGSGFDRYFEEFARGLVLTEPPTSSTGPLAPLLGLLKTVGLVTYVLTTAVISVSVAFPVKLLRSVF